MIQKDRVLSQQIAFARMNKDIEKHENASFPDKHTVIQDDIKRLRRELLELSKMYEWEYKWNYKGE